VRRKFDDSQVDTRFREVWESLISVSLETAPVVTIEEAKELLGDEKRAAYVIPGYEYRQFSVDSAAFLARVSRNREDLDCDQLWSIGAHRDPTRLCVHFETIEALTQFSAVSRRLGYKPKDLLLALGMDFLSKFRVELETRNSE